MNTELILDNKYIIQHPNDNNCLLIALANLFIHDGTMTTSEGFKLVKRLTEKFNVNKRGAQPMLIGETLYNMGYDQLLVMTPGDSNCLNKLQDEGWLGIRVFTTDLWYSTYLDFLVNTEEYSHFGAWKMKFLDKNPIAPISRNQSVTFGRGARYTAHAVFYYNFVNNEFDSTADCINVTHRVSKCKWFKMGSEQDGPRLKEMKAIGSQFCIMAKKRDD